MTDLDVLEDLFHARVKLLGIGVNLSDVTRFAHNSVYILVQSIGKKFADGAAIRRLFPRSVPR